MEKPKLKDREKIIGKLKFFWKRYWKKKGRFRGSIIDLEKEMTNEAGLGIELEFFYVNSECVGIGASKIEDRKKFSLIHDSELND